VAGKALAAEEIRLELRRREWSGQLGDNFPQETVKLELQDIESTDPLEVAIDNELEKQAVGRLGYLPSVEDAKTAAREQEQNSFEILATVTPEARSSLEDALRATGMLKRNWADDPEIVQRFRVNLGLAKLRKTECKETPEVVRSPLALVTLAGHKCSDFLANERKSAKIVYYVRWAD